MKKLIPLLLAALLPVTSLATPRIACDDRVHNFGTLSDSDTVEHTFTLRNDGDEDIVITKVRTCCGGTADLKDEVIAPGMKTTLQASMSLVGRYGSFNKAYYVLSNDPQSPLFKLGFRGAIKRRPNKPVSAGTRLHSARGANASHPLGIADPKQPISAIGDMPPELLPKVVPTPEPTLAMNAKVPVIVDYFYETGCADCMIVNNQTLPQLHSQFSGQFDLRLHDLGETSNVVVLVGYQEALGITNDESVLIVVDYADVLNGVDEILEGLPLLVEEALRARSDENWVPPVPIDIPDRAEAVGVAEQRVSRFTWTMVAGAGFADGINPCAIGTLVFFMSLLSVSKIRGPKLLAVGIPFCIASFLAYSAIGFGLLSVLHSFAGFPKLQSAIEILMTALLVLLAWLSFRDAYRYMRSSDPTDVTLQLPDSIKQRIRVILRAGLKASNLAIGAFVIGIAVTILESVCTGQVYVPTLVLVAKEGSSRGSALAYLSLYNFMFILPLILVFAATYKGVNTEQLITWSKRNVVPAKLLLGLLFAVMAVLIIAA